MGVKSKLMRVLTQRKRPCPSCWLMAPLDATFCLACGKTLGAAPEAEDTALIQGPEAALREPDPALDAAVEVEELEPCTHCSQLVPVGARYCHSCGQQIPLKYRDGGTRPLGGFDLPVGTYRPRLAVLNADGSLRRAWPITSDLVLIGRTQGDVLLERDPFIAERHARLSRQEEAWVLEDLRTANGVYRRVKGSAELDTGDYFRVGRQLFRVTSHVELFGSSPPPLPPTGVSFFGSPEPRVGAYLSQLLGNRRIGHLLSIVPGRPRVVGREQGDLSFPEDDYLSGRHVQIDARANGGCKVTDLGSTNGIYVRLTAPTPISAGDLLLFGETLVRFEQG